MRQGVRGLLRDLHLHTVCESARCPNLAECWRRRAATFLLLGNVCTRNCAFCAVDHGSPAPVDEKEPERIVEAVGRLGLRFVVLTCVTRDDLADGGAGHIAAVVRALRQADPEIGVEVLVSDLRGCRDDVRSILDSGPGVFNHNVETVERLTGEIRDRARYRRSLSVLRQAADAAETTPGLRVKSGLMLGLGETEEEIRRTLMDLRDAGVEAVTMGQYLPPSPRHWPVSRYVDPEEFAAWRTFGLEECGFAAVVSGPLVRSSYLAEETAALAAARRQALS